MVRMMAIDGQAELARIRNDAGEMDYWEQFLDNMFDGNLDTLCHSDSYTVNKEITINWIQGELKQFYRFCWKHV